jgi:DNA-binding MarR family transcriptional regulator
MSSHASAHSLQIAMTPETQERIYCCNKIAYVLSKIRIMVAHMQVSLVQCNKFLRAVAPSGNLFLLLTLQELRRQGLTFVAFYALQRAIEYPGSSESALRQETGLADYEISRACKFLDSRKLIVIGPAEKDRRVRLLRPTKLGITIHDQVLLAAAKKLQKDFSSEDRLSISGENRRLTEASESFRKGNRTLRGSFQVSFLDTHLAEMKS